MPRLFLCLMLVLGHPALALGHELPDGEIDRRVQVSVKPDVVLVEYSLAMNEATLEKQLRQHGEEPAESLPDMWKQYQPIVLSMLSRQIRLSVGDKSPNLLPVRAAYSGWSHGHLTCLLRAEIVLTQQLKTIVVSDGNFPDTPGDYRIAMKGRSGAKMKSSTVSRLVTRAEPIVLAELSAEQKQAAARAQGEFALEQPR